MNFQRAYEKYKEVKNFVKTDELPEIEERLIHDIKNRNLKAYLEICIEKDKKEIVLESIVNPPEYRYKIEGFAEKLKEDYPKEIIEYYYKRAFNNIENGNRKTYKVAVEYLQKAKYIYFNILKDKKRWSNKIAEIKEHYSKRRAFLDEARKL